MRKQEQQTPIPRPSRYLVRWRCPYCAFTCCGYIEAYDYQPRVCRGIPKRQNSEGSICGEIMEITLDERERSRGYSPLRNAQQEQEWLKSGRDGAV